MNVSKRHASHPSMIRGLGTAELRNLYLIDGLFVPESVSLVHNQIERMIIGGVAPVSKPVELADCAARLPRSARY